MTPTIEDLVTLGLRVGTVTGPEPNIGARDPACWQWIDFGDLGTL